MNEQQRDELIRRMEEAVLLPAGDPIRRQTYDAVLEAGDWAREYWLALVEQDERLRLELLAVEPPAGLRDRLRKLAEVEPAERLDGPVAAVFTRRRWLAMAASVAALLSVVTVLALNDADGNRELEQRFQQLGEAVQAHHSVGHRVRFATAEPEQVTARFADAFAWQVRPPTMEPGYQLEGATECRLAGRPVLCMQWRDEAGRRHTVFQFCAPDYGLPEAFERRVVAAAEALRDSAGAEVTFWTEGECAYVMTADEHDDSQQLSADNSST